MSYTFYAAWNPPFVLLLILSTIYDYIIAKKIENCAIKRSRKLLLSSSLLLNLGLLAYFKYGNFFLTNFLNLIGFVGHEVHLQPMEIILPVGISFYTFQTLSYTIDVYRKKIRTVDSILDYALYISFFPQLVAGPIVRASSFLPQCKKPNRATMAEVGWGSCLFLIGLFQKVVIADTLMSPIVETVYNSHAIPSFQAAWFSTFAFSIQIFCDFAGYSSCAIGIAMCLGFQLTENFRHPYAAIGFSDFWRRWHISLSTWLKDYLYIPMGGNRKGEFRTYFNLFATMLIGGLWHGAAWTFIVWGGLHGIFLTIERVVKNTKKFNHEKSNFILNFSLSIITFIIVSITWVFFRADSLRSAFKILLSMTCLPEQSATLSLSSPQPEIVAFTTAFIILYQYIMRKTSIIEFYKTTHWSCVSVLNILMLLLIIYSFSGTDNAFIYFQF